MSGTCTHDDCLGQFWEVLLDTETSVLLVPHMAAHSPNVGRPTDHISDNWGLETQWSHQRLAVCGCWVHSLRQTRGSGCSASSGATATMAWCRRGWMTGRCLGSRDWNGSRRVETVTHFGLGVLLGWAGEQGQTLWFWCTAMCSSLSLRKAISSRVGLIMRGTARPAKYQGGGLQGWGTG